MADTVNKQHRSWVMSRIRSDNTKPELVMRSLLHRAGFRYSFKRKLPGKPDIVFPKYKAVLFVNGCFWHWHKEAGCKISKLPKSNTAFWLKKLQATVARDECKRKELQELGWRVMTVWECEVLGQPRQTLTRVVEWLRNNHNCSEDPTLIMAPDVQGVLAAAKIRHRNILKQRTGHYRYCHDENT